MLSKVTTITINGVEKTIYDWCREYGLNTSMVYKRIERGWPVERLFEESSATPRRRDGAEKPEYRRELIHELWGGEWVYVGGRAYK